jgi:hypothetical protein
MMMNVDGLGNGIIGRLSAVSDGRTHQRARGGDPAGPPEQVTPAAPPAAEPAEDEAAADADAGGAGQKGVLRLLQEGHFKGVADVRLRINFYEEFSAMAAAKAAQTMTTGTGELTAGVTAKAQELVSSWGLDEGAQNAANDLLAQFETAARTAVQESASDGVVDATGLAEALRTAFDSFLAQLAALAPLPADTVEPATDDAAEPATDDTVESVTGDAAEPGQSELPTDPGIPPAVEPPAAGETTFTADVAGAGTEDSADPEQPVEAAADVQSPAVPNPDIESLRQLFADGLARLLASIEDASQLPPLASQPPGNGKAYNKFLAIYNELAGQASPAEPSTASGDEHVDLVL